MNPLVWIGNALRWLAGLIAPMFIRPRISPGVLWFLHVLFIAGICVGLWYLEKHFAITINIEGPVWLRPFWLPILFLLVYFLAWQAWWLWKLLQPGESISPFPDLDEAWAGILDALDKAGIGIADTPVFVVIGQPRSGEGGLFTALPRGLTVNGAPSGAASLRVYANREAIYLTCPAVTLLAIQEATGGGSDLAESYSPKSAALDASIGMDKSIGMSGEGSGGTIAQVQQIIRRARDQNRSLTEQEKTQIRQLSGGAGFSTEGAKQPSGPSVLQDARTVERQTTRMRYFSSLVARSRWPLCPINGAIIVVPAGAAEKDESAQQTGLVAQKDLATMVDAFRLRFPVYALISDVEALPGAAEFLARFAQDKRQQRLGKSFPLNPDLKPTAVAEAVESATSWIFGSLLPYWVYKLFRLETPNVETPNEAARTNGELIQFLAAVKDRADKMSRLVSRAVMPRVDEVPTYGGCYLTAVESQGSSEPLFAQEFFKKVESTQGFVAWTDEAFGLDASYRSMTKTGYLALGVIAAAVAALAVYVFGLRNA
jgi:hypothetical protein